MLTCHSTSVDPTLEKIQVSPMLVKCLDDYTGWIDKKFGTHMRNYKNFGDPLSTTLYFKSPCLAFKVYNHLINAL